MNDIEFHAVKDLGCLPNVVASSHYGGRWSHHSGCKGLPRWRLERATGWHDGVRLLRSYETWVDRITTHGSSGVRDVHLLLLQGGLDSLEHLYDFEVGLEVGCWHTSVLDHAVGTLDTYPYRQSLSFLEGQAEEAV